MVSNFDKYHITPYGEVYNTKTGRKLLNQDNGSGYRKITLTISGNQKQYYVHRLVAMIYIPNPMNLNQINHKNGVKSDNYIGNLEWCTNSSNQIHAHTTGLKKSGMGLWNAKFNVSDLKKIRKLKADGMLQYKIAIIMGVAKSTISDILNGKRYKY